MTLQTKKLDIKELKRELEGKPQKKSFDTKGHSIIDEEARVLEFSVSSEEPYLRWFGFETLRHGSDNVSMERFNNKPAFLDGHDWDKQIGVIEKAWIEDSRLKAHVRFSKNAHATEVYNDIIDGIRTKVSIGYEVKDIELVKENGEERYFDVMKWEPYEASSVSIPADDSVGFGRSKEIEIIEKAIEKSEVGAESLANEVSKSLKAEESEPDDQGNIEIKNTTIIEVKEMELSEQEKKALTDAGSAEGKNVERKRIAELLEVGSEFTKNDLARSFIAEGKTVDQLRKAILADYKKAPTEFAKDQTGDSLNITLDAKETEAYSLNRAIKAQINGTWNSGSYERDVSDEIAKKQGREAQGFFIPRMVRGAGQTAGTNADGGFVIGTDVRTDDYIDKLRNVSRVIQLGATELRDLSGNIAIPRKITDNAVEMQAENTGATESKFTLDQVSLSPKFFTTNDSYSKQLFDQTSGDIENLIINSLTTAMALKIDDQALSGSGSGNEAEGIRNTTGIGDVATATDGSAPTWAFMVDMETQVAIDNALDGQLSYLINSATNGKLKTVEKASSTAQFLKMGDTVNGYNCAISNQLPSNITKNSGSALSTALFGNWSDLLIGYWGGLDLVIDPYTNSTAGKVRITAHQLADVAVRHAESFCEMSGIITV